MVSSMVDAVLIHLSNLQVWWTFEANALYVVRYLHKVFDLPSHFILHLLISLSSNNEKTRLAYYMHICSSIFIEDKTLRNNCKYLAFVIVLMEIFWKAKYAALSFQYADIHSQTPKHVLN